MINGLNTYMSQNDLNMLRPIKYHLLGHVPAIRGRRETALIPSRLAQDKPEREIGRERERDRQTEPDTGRASEQALYEKY